MVCLSESLSNRAARGLPIRNQDRSDQVPPLPQGQIEVMAETMESLRHVAVQYPDGEMFTRTVRLVGVNADTRADIGG